MKKFLKDITGITAKENALAAEKMQYPVRKQLSPIASCLG